MMNKSILLTTVLLMLAGGAWAQTLAPVEVASAGKEQAASGFRLSWTLGQTAVPTAKSGSVVLTQGFQQPFLPLALAVEPARVEVGTLTLYPNPNPGEAFFRGEFLAPGRLSLSVLDLQGRRVWAAEPQEVGSTGQAETRLNLDALSASFYTLRVEFQPEHGPAYPVRFLKFDLVR